MYIVYKLLAIGFPAGYRFLAINLISYFCARNVSDFFSQSFFMISLLATLSGFAVSSQSYIVSRELSLPRRLLLVIIFLGASSGPCYLLWRGGFESYFVALIAALGYSVFEISRSDLAAKGKFNVLVLQGSVAVCLIGPCLYLWHESPFYLVLSFFWVLAITAIVFGAPKLIGGDSLSFDVLKDISSYSLSNGISTGLMFVIPILLIAEYGEGSATDLAKTVTLSTIFLLFPKYLSAGFMIDLQRNQNWEMTKAFEAKVVIYVSLVCAGIAIATITLFNNLMSYLMLFMAIQFSQLGLPHASVHAVLGRGMIMLQVNIKSLLFLSVCTLVIYWLFDAGALRGCMLLSVYMVYILLRTYMTRVSCIKILKNQFENKTELSLENSR